MQYDAYVRNKIKKELKESSGLYLHQPGICSYHLQHMPVGCTLDSIPHCSWQLDMEFGGPIDLFEHWTVANFIISQCEKRF